LKTGLPIRLLTALGALLMLHAAVWAQAFPPPGQTTAPQGAPQGGSFPPPGQSAPAPGPNSFPAPGATSPGGFSPAPGGLGAPGGMGGGMGGFGGGGAPQGPSAAQQACIGEFNRLKGEVESRGKRVSAAGQQKVSPDVACKLIGSFSQAEDNWIKFVATKGPGCGIPPTFGPQLKASHVRTVQLQQRVCEAAKQGPAGPAGPSLSDVLGSPSLPEAPQTKKPGGSTFDTINGNALSR
jgi:hypothetical protein